MNDDSDSDVLPVPVTRRDRVVVSGLHVDTYIGVHDFERLERQAVRFDVEVETVNGYARLVRDTGSYVSYADIVEFIEQRAEHGGHVDLVETWAEDVASFVLKHELADSVRVRVLKTAIFERADGVGIEIERRADAATRSAGDR